MDPETPPLDDADDKRAKTPESMPRLARPQVPELDAILGHQFRLLDDGFVRVIDYMGDDGAVVQAARVSYGAGTKKVQDDRALIRYLMRHHHTTPFEMCEIKLHVRVPMDTWRQWIRHRTASVNEYSTRYSLAIDAAQRTAGTDWRAQGFANRQGSGARIDNHIGERLTAAEAELQDRARAVYADRIAAGVAREQARKDLPLSTYTEAYWKIDLHNLLHFLELRLHEHAQIEIRSYARTIGERIVSKWVPDVWSAFLDYRLGAIHLSRLEVEVLVALAKGDAPQAAAVLTDRGLLKRGKDGHLTRSRERAELENKLVTMGFHLPWVAEPRDTRSDNE